MSAGKVKASKVKVHQPPDGIAPDSHFHVYVFDVFNKAFTTAKAFDKVERAAAFQRHEQERIYAEQEADPELVRRVERDGEYKKRLVRDLKGDARARGRRH